ncbi:MAG TPA: Gfo/Idh/MocA family oxidoreductase [Candidatus Omnitrophota bacterium]|nr:Gfo/Idh/MocA family oxidoreductase [Candidatus Omnitrophota bacterium]
MKFVRIGVIGAGKTAQWHVRAYRSIPGVRVQAIANPRSDRGLRLQSSAGIREFYRNAHECIRSADLDAVDICVPAEFHKGYVLAAVRKGLHVYCEKPLCPSADECAEIIDANKTAGRVIFNGFNYRFMPAFRRLLAIIRSGDMGQLKYIRILRTCKESPAGTLRGSMIFNESVCHYYDLLSLFGLGRIERLTTHGTRALDWNIDPDIATTVLYYSGGAVADVTCSHAAPGLAPEIFIVGSKASVTVRNGSTQFIRHRDVWPLGGLLMLLARDTIRFPLSILHNPFAGSCRHFIECIRNNRRSECDETAAFNALKIADAALASYQTKKEVSIH